MIDFYYKYQLNIRLFFCLVSVSFFLISISIKAQTDLSFRQLSVNDGLSQNSAISISQDSQGFLWIATQDGLNRYDGKEFKFFNKKFADITQESHLQLGKVYADSKNRIWIIPDTSIPELFNPLTNDFEPIKGIKDACSFHEDLNGNIWIGSFSGQLFKWNEIIQAPEMIWTDPSKEIIHIDHYENQELLLTFINHVAIWNNQNHQMRLVEFSESDINFSCSIKDSKGNIWIGSLNKGVFFVESGKLKAINISEKFKNQVEVLGSKMVLDIMENSNGEIWIGTYGKGVFRIDPTLNEIQNLTYNKLNPRSLHYNDVLCLFEDYSKIMWLGTDGAGLSFYDTYLEKFDFFHNQQVPENINIDVVRSIFVDENKKIWIGTSGKGLTSFDPKTNVWKTFIHNNKNPNGIASNRVMSLLGDKKGKLWIGYQEEGLSILDLKTGEFTHYKSNSKVALPSQTIWKIYQDKTDKFWLATRNDGLIQFDPQKGIQQQFTHNPNDPNSIPGNNIRTIEEGRNGELWIGTENQGIAKLDLASGKFQVFSHNSELPNSLSSNSIKSLYFDGKNTLWIGTNGSGINSLDINNGEFTSISTKQGLANDVIYAILPDESDNLWMSSNKGITKISIYPSTSPSFRITNYTNYDGLATEFNTGAYFKDKEGSIYFGSLEGFYWFNSEDISLNEIPPKTAITNLFAFNKQISITDDIKLRHNENTLTIDMASLVFSSPDKNEFQYKLENHDEFWVQAGNNHQARYTNLPPGQYTFLAKSSNYDGIWSVAPVSLKFTILPPWYLTMWAKLIYILLFSSAFVWIYLYFKWRWRVKFLIKLKEEEADRLIEIDKFKTNLFTNISHEFRTPLTLIVGPVDRLIEQSENPIVKSQLNLVKQNSQRLLNLVDQLLEVSKIKTGRNQLKVKKGNLGLLLQSIVAKFFYLAAEKNMRIIPEIPLMTELWFDGDKIEKILSNLLQNAIKYGKSHTDIELKSYTENQNLNLSVSNCSNKIYSKEEVSHLFDKFYKPDSDSDGFGIGLPLVKDLVELNHGEINLEVNEEHKTFTVSIQVPVDQFAFKPGEVIEVNQELNIPSKINQNQNSESDAPWVLVIEDNEDMRSFLVRELKFYYNILEASNGKEGLYLALKKIPDLIVSDVMMPEKNGVELCEAVKNDEKTSHIPIILLTAMSEETDKIKGLKVGADDYILKPFAINQLLVRIEKLIELRKNLRERYSGKTQISPKEIAVTSTDEKFLDKIQNIVDHDLSDNNFTVDQFCKKLGMSRMQLHRKLTALTGLSTTAFMRDQRLRMALKRLEKSDESISEIAYTVGFSSPSYFIKCFKETYQMTPSEYLSNMEK